MRVINKLFKTPSFKKILYKLIRLAKKTGADDKNIKTMVKLISAFNPDFKTHYSYVKITDAASHGLLIDSIEVTLCAAKPQYYYNKNDTYYTTSKYADIKQINNVVVYGSTSIISIDDEIVIHQTYQNDIHNKYNFNDAVIIRSCFKPHLLIQYKQSGNIINKGILLSGSFSFNYYHLLFEYLSRLSCLESTQIPIDVPLLVDEVVANVPQYNELLQLLNIDNRQVILLKSSYSYNVRQLYVLPVINVVPSDYINIEEIEYTDCLFSVENITYVRNKLLSKTNNQSKYKRIFLSRKNASNRRTYNEDEIVEIFKKHDFEIIYPENYSVLDQVAIFNGADIIAGVTGAAFTNIIFCKEKCKILCMQSVNTELSIFSTIAKNLKLDLQYYCDESNSYEINNIHDRFIIEPNKIESIIIDFISK